jgi:hypothetical protein
MLPIAVFTTISLRRRPKRLDVPRRTQCNFIQIRYCASIRPLRMSVLSTPTMDLSKLEFAGTVWELINKGRLCPLIAYLRSDKPLAPSDRDSLADLLQGKLKRRIGRPKGGLDAQKVRFLALLVRDVKSDMRQRGERYRIHDKAIDHVLSLYTYNGKPPVGREKLEN